MEISKANTDDSVQIGSLLVEAWRHAYKDIMSASLLEGLSIQKRSVGWKKHLESGAEVYVLKNKTEILGVVEVCKFRDKIDRFTQYAEIPVLYLKPNAIGKGYGSNLLNYAQKRISEYDSEGTALWVLEKNMAGIDFYKKHGYSYCGEHKLHNTDLVEHLYTKIA